jgi:hypothetical protein
MKKRFFLFLFLLVPLPAYADDNDDLEDLGWIAIGVGVLANVPFILFVKVRKYAKYAGSEGINFVKQMTPAYKSILNLHVLLNALGYTAGMTHGFMLMRYLDPISLSLAVVMTFLMISGMLLRYTSTRNTKIFNKLLHSQFVMVILLIGLIIMHTMFADD